MKRVSSHTANPRISITGLRLFRPGATLVVALILAGCVLALPAYNEPFDEKVVIISRSPQLVNVQIDGSQQETISVPADGRVVLHFPVLPRECSTYLLGLRVKDRSVEARRIIEFIRDGRAVRRMSIKQLRHLPVDQEGYHQLTLR